MGREVKKEEGVRGKWGKWRSDVWVIKWDGE